MPIHRRLLAEFFDVTLDELGFAAPLTSMRRESAGSMSADVDAFPFSRTPRGLEPRVRADQEHWRVVRRGLNEHRVGLARVAAGLHGEKGGHVEGGLVSEEPSGLKKQDHQRDQDDQHHAPNRKPAHRRRRHRRGWQMGQESDDQGSAR